MFPSKIVVFIDSDISKAQKATEIWDGNYYLQLSFIEHYSVIGG